jgi:hypothetical protein
LLQQKSRSAGGYLRNNGAGCSPQPSAFHPNFWKKKSMYEVYGTESAMSSKQDTAVKPQKFVSC